MYTTCETKDYFDTNFEALVMAAKATSRYSEDYEPYKCRNCNGFHITHVSPLKRRGYGKKFWRCPRCKWILQQKNAGQHRCPVVE